MAAKLPKRPTYYTLIIVGTVVAIITAFITPSTRKVQAQTTCADPFISVSPALTDLGSGEYVRLNDGPTGHLGGLYPGGVSSPPANHLDSALALAAQITPLNSQGNPDPINGSIGMISIGMSNTRSEFNAFMTDVNNASNINPRLEIVNGAISSMTSDAWAFPTPQRNPWSLLDSWIAGQGLTPAQIQVAWVKLAQAGGGDFPEKAESLQGDLEIVVRSLRTRFPNLKIAYLASRTRAYKYWNALSPEPVAFETGFAVRWMIEKQINGDPNLNYDPSNGPVVAPLLLWGPYLWADGSNPRGDGLVWLPEDLASDCIHPSASGNEKVGNLLLEFFQSDSSTVSWFLGDPGLTPTPPPTPTSTPFPNMTPQAYLPVIPDNYQYSASPDLPARPATHPEDAEASLIQDLRITGAATFLLILLGMGFMVWWRPQG